VTFADRYSKLLEDPDVLRWHENVARGSEVTADVYLRRLGKFCAERGITPRRLLSLPDASLRDMFMDFVNEAERRGHAGSYTESVLKAIKSWLAHNGRQFGWKIKIKGARDTPTLANERVPTQDELRQIFMAGDNRTRTACALVAHSGLRIQSLGNYAGDDGLRLKDLPELVIRGGEVEFEQTPTMVVVRQSLSKAGHQYFTFLSDEGAGYVRRWLEQRIKEGEKLTPDSPIVTSKFRAMRGFISNTNVRDAIRGAIRRAGFGWRPYVLRAYFDTQLMLAESKGLVLRDYRQFWMGHKGDIEARYTTNKRRLPESVVEDMREAYRRSQVFLESTQGKAPSKDLKQELRHQLLLVAGMKEKEIEELDLSGMSDEEFQGLIRKKLLSSSLPNCATQKIVSVEELERYISQGWEFAAVLPDRRAVIRMPH
jgi:hypothetical protein